MKNRKRLFSALLAVVMMLTMSVSAMAASNDTGFSDISADAWYADAVEYVRDNGLMNGTSATTFSPGSNTSRSMLTAILYRASGSPAVSNPVSFRDVASDAYYANAVSWAAGSGIVSGYGNGLFGSDDPVSREQISTILWRYAGSPDAEQGQSFADGSAIAAYATDAVNWARVNGIVSGKAGNQFDPKGNATRAQVATILRNYMTQSENQTPTTGDGSIAVVYFSATGSTKAVAQTISDTLDADLIEIVPETPYTSADLNWNEPSSRVNTEHENPASRPAIAGGAMDLTTYDTVFLGYPIWWGEAPNILRTFMESNALSGKTIIPFCTSSSSGLGSSAETLKAYAPNATWMDGQRFSSGASEATVREWVLGLNLKATETPSGQESRSLVVYFSLPETTNPSNMTTEEANSTVVINGEVLGNTQYMAQVIGQTAGADIFRIEPETPYPTNHSTLVDQASDEQAANARPAIKNQIANFDDYDTVFIGYPIWWSDMPMILYSFFDTYDFSGKTIVPFSTHGGSSFAGTPATIRELEPNATILDGLTISRNNIQEAEREIVNWVNGLGV